MANLQNQSTHYKLVTYWLMCHLRSFLSAMGDLIRAPFASFMTIMVIGIAVALPCGLYLILQNFQTLSHNWSGKPTISLYLKKNMAAQQIQNLQQKLSQNPLITKVTYISPQQGLKDFSKVTSFGQVVSKLGTNPLPPVLIITPQKNQQTPQALQHLFNSLKSLPQVATGVLDLVWIKRLYFILTLGKHSMYALGVIFGLGVIFIVGNTIRLTMQNHVHEMNVLKLIGATNAFIRRPLLYRGLLYGLIGGTIAWILIVLILYWLQSPAIALAKTYQHDFKIHGLNLAAGFKIIGLSCLLGLIGAWLAVAKHLNYQDNP